MEKFRELQNFEESKLFSVREKTALRLARVLSESPANVNDALYEELKASFDEKARVELASIIAWENYRSRFNRTFNVGSDSLSEGAVCLLPQGN